NYGGDPGGAAEQKVFGLGNDDSFYLSPGLEALRGALRFDLSSIPSGAEITNATLTMQFAGSSGSQSAPLPLFFSPYQASWSEDSITWNNRPSVDGAHQVEGSFPLSGFNPTQNDVTALATKWEDGTLANNGVEVSIPSWETANYKAKYFYQKEWAADRVATLQVTYLKPCTATLPPSVPTPVDTATGLDSPVNLGWAAVTGASGYEIYLGTSPGSLSPLSLTPHPFAVLSGLQPTTTFYWRVDSIAACDASLKTSSPTWSFTTSTCVDPQPPQVSNPAPGSTGLGSQVTLSWTSVPGTSFYEVYLWKSNEPEALLRSVNGLSTVAVVDSASTYAWKVVAVPACDPNLSASSSVETFTTASGPVAHVGSDSKVAVGGSVQLGDTPAASGGSPGYSYQWSVVPTGSASLSSASTPNPVLTGLAPGNVVCTLTVTDSNGFQSVPVQVNVLVEEPLFLDGFESGDLNAWSSFTSGL
ncbi:MAG: DNRLRE domain-containing protein, partial [Thermoanaerobaculia bacterium]|nr:DNRLRE domain-containing protein [Thermoanaerobaculia bacterium]